MTNHPNREEWLEFLYQEQAPERQAELANHLEACAECHAQVESWRGTRRQLAEWKLGPRDGSQVGPRAVSPSPIGWEIAGVRVAPGGRALGWAAAAAVFLVAGFGAARLLAPKPDMTALRAAIVRDVRQEFQAELERYASAQAANQACYQEALTKVLGQLEAKRLVENTQLRRDLETVAVSAQNEFLTTRENLARLVKFEEPAPGSER
jgi:hypothetical protein